MTIGPASRGAYWLRSRFISSIASVLSCRISAAS
jgi:hypothetical protein